MQNDSLANSKKLIKHYMAIINTAKKFYAIDEPLMEIEDTQRRRFIATIAPSAIKLDWINGLVYAVVRDNDGNPMVALFKGCGQVFSTDPFDHVGNVVAHNFISREALDVTNGRNDKWEYDKPVGELPVGKMILTPVADDNTLMNLALTVNEDFEAQFSLTSCLNALRMSIGDQQDPIVRAQLTMLLVRNQHTTTRLQSLLES